MNKITPERTCLNFEEIALRGTKISSEEAFRDVTPVKWSEDVLAGKYVGHPLIKEFDNDSLEDIKKVFMYQQNLSQIGKINFPEIILHGTKVSSEEALRDVTPVEWSEDVLAGKYRGKTLIKAKSYDKK